MSQQASHLWKPIEDLPPNAGGLAKPETAALVAAWKKYAHSLKNRDGYRHFLTRLRRQWAIETGVLERLYSVSEGATKTLIEKGFDEALISHGDTDRPASEVIAIIIDQHHAIEGLYQFVSGNRPLGTSYIKELHRVLTEHQPRYDAIDTLGQPVERDLPRGEWKKLPNNVEGPDGFVFQFCPPEHVDAEMERLLRMHEEHERAGIPPDLEAAWLHHRFTLIHPFTDGNGRVARCLASLILLKAEWFPLVVTRDDRAEYIEALRIADRGNTEELVRLFDKLQDRTIRKALEIDADTAEQALEVGDIVEAVKAKLLLSSEQAEQHHKRALEEGVMLFSIAHDRLGEIAEDIESRMRGSIPGFRAYADALPHPSAKGSEETRILMNSIRSYWPDTGTFCAWARLVLVTELQVEVAFLFHGIGRQTGVLGCSGAAYTRGKFNSQEIIENEIELTNEPFYFTSLEDSAAMRNRFRKWLEQTILIGLNYWRKLIGA